MYCSTSPKSTVGNLAQRPSETPPIFNSKYFISVEPSASTGETWCSWVYS